MTDALFDDAAYVNPGPCGTCGRPASNGRCPWCDSSTTGREAGHKAASYAADADPEFADAATAALVHVRAKGEPFTAADVREVLENRGVRITRPAALGSVFGTMHALGLIKPTGDFLPSPIKGQHGRPLRVWRAA